MPKCVLLLYFIMLPPTAPQPKGWEQIDNKLALQRVLEAMELEDWGGVPTYYSQETDEGPYTEHVDWGSMRRSYRAQYPPLWCATQLPKEDILRKNLRFARDRLDYIDKSLSFVGAHNRTMVEQQYEEQKAVVNLYENALETIADRPAVKRREALQRVLGVIGPSWIMPPPVVLSHYQVR